MKNLRLVLNNFIIKLSSDLYSRLGMLVLVVLIARIYGAEQFGRFTLAFALVNMLYFVTDLGLSVLFIRDAARNITLSKKYWEKILFFKLFACIVTTCVIFIIAFLFSYGEETVRMIAIATVWMLANSFIDLINSYFTAMEKLKPVLINTLLYRTVLYLIVAYCFYIQASIEVVCSLFALSSIIGCMGGFFILILHIGSFKIHFDLEFIKSKLKEALPIAIAGILIGVYLRLDTLILSKIAGEVQVGLYNSAFKLFETLMFVPTIFQSVIMPRFVQYLDDKQRLVQAAEKAVLFLLILVLPVSAILHFKSSWIISILYGNEFEGGAKSLAIIAPAITLMFLHCIPSTLLISQNRQRWIVISSLWALVINIIGNLILIPLYGYYGASIMVVVTQAVMVSVMYYSCRETLINWALMIGTLKLITCTGFVGLFLYYVEFEYTVIEIGLSILLFYLLIISFRVINISEIKEYLSEIFVNRFGSAKKK